MAVVMLCVSVDRFLCQSLVTVHLMYANITFSSVWVPEWPPFGKELSTRLTICSLCILTIFFYLFPVLRAGFAF